MGVDSSRRLALALIAVGAFLTTSSFAQDDPVQTFVRGDVVVDGNFDILDVFDSLGYFFNGETPAIDCDKAYDFNDSGGLDLADPIFFLGYIFLDADAPAAPFPRCGADPTEDTLTCEEFTDCPEMVPTDLDEAAHVLRRVAYGQTPDLLDHVLEVGALNYISEQLDPEDIDETGNGTMNDLIDVITPANNLGDLVRLQAIRGIYSDRQLNEVMTDFWENHFNTYWRTVFLYFRRIRFDGPGGVLYGPEAAAQQATYFEYLENAALRDNALGDFQDLVEISATSVTMLIYLDNVSNEAGNPNENYSRELLELHTMGVDNGYTQTDIEELARVFTGWRVCMVDFDDVGDPLADCQPLVNADSNVWDFHFDEDLHDDEEKIIFEGTSYEISLGVDQTGVDEGLDFIEHVSTLPQTAEYVSTKLIEKFVNDEPPLALIADCVTVWDDTEGDIRQVVETILTSDEFFDEVNRLDKVRTPIESIYATVRAFDGVVEARMREIVQAMEQMFHFPFFFETPDGFPEKGADQIGTQKLRNLIDFNESIYARGDDISFEDNVVAIMDDRGVDLDDAEDVVTFWMDRLFGDLYDETDKQLAIDFLETNVGGVELELDSEADNYLFRILTVLGFIADYPQHLEQ